MKLSSTSPGAQLELEKLSLEIQTMRRWYFRPAALQALAAVVLGLGALSTGYLTGWFDVQRVRLENQKERLGLESERLQDKRDGLNRQIATLTAERDGLRSQVQTTSGQLEEQVRRNKKFVASSDEVAALLFNSMRELTDIQTGIAQARQMNMTGMDSVLVDAKLSQQRIKMDALFKELSGGIAKVARALGRNVNAPWDRKAK